MKLLFRPAALVFLTYLVVSEVQVQKTYGVCVHGGTSSGVMAAYYTAQMWGKSVLLIEPTKHSGELGQTDIGNK